MDKRFLLHRQEESESEQERFCQHTSPAGRHLDAPEGLHGSLLDLGMVAQEGIQDIQEGGGGYKSTI